MDELKELTTENSQGRWPRVLLWAAMLVFAAQACTHMVAAGDTWVALACGKHFLAHGVNTVEPFSANSHKPGPTDEQLKDFPKWLHGTIRKIHPTGWINQNWLTHLMFYWLVEKFDPSFTGYDGSFNPLVYWKFAVNLLTVICIYYFARTLGVDQFWAAAAACSAMFIGRSFIDVRPAVHSNMITPAFLLILALASYRNIRYIWLIVPLVVLWCNLHGGYIYAFMMLVPFAGIHLIMLPFRQKFINIGFKGVLVTSAASVAAFFAMIIFNPFHLTNLTHTFEITISKHAQSWRTVNEWRPAFDWLDKSTTEPNPVGDEEAFGVMCIILLVVLAARIITGYFKPQIATRHRARQNADTDSAYYKPKNDPAIILISLLTTYMAVRSRRFIPIAATVACPVIALYIGQTIRLITARMSFIKTGKFIPMPMPAGLGRIVTGIAGLTVLGLATFWGYKYKTVYLDPWPIDSVRDSVFMRMTASNVKPFDVCTFIRENNLGGNVFNYWTEGGAIAFGQEPDPLTGRTPLQLFMDGRAQAAYNHDKFRLWQEIHAGGLLFATAARRYGGDTDLTEKNLTAGEYSAISEWLDSQMKKYNVWVVLMPTNQVNSILMRALRRTANWKQAYIDNDQHLLIDTDTEKGKQLFSDILTGNAKFPSEFSKNLVLAENLMRVPDPQAEKKGFECARQAFEERPSQASVFPLAYATSKPEYAGQTVKLLRDFIDDFIQNKNTYAEQGGYIERLTAALSISNFMKAVLNKNDPQAAKKYGDFYESCAEEPLTVSQKARW